MDWKTMGKNKWLVIVGVIGVLCLLSGSMFSGNVKSTLSTSSDQTNTNAVAQSSSGNPDNVSDQQVQAFESQYSKQLQNMLQQIDGIYHVSVMVTVDSTETLKLANNEQQTNSTQSNGQSTSTSTTTNDQIFTLNNGNGSTTPIVIEKIAPHVRGVLVIVDAKDFAVAKSEIIDAIQNVLDVPAYKISVEPQKVNE